MAKKTNSFENKKTSELLDLVKTLVDDRGNIQEGYEEVLDELKSREPFYSIWKPIDDDTIVEEIESLREDIKILKRHKHDEKTGDVMARL